MKIENLERAKELAKEIRNYEGKLSIITETEGSAEIKKTRTIFKGLDINGQFIEVGIDDLLPVESFIGLAVANIKKNLEDMKNELESL